MMRTLPLYLLALPFAVAAEPEISCPLILQNDAVTVHAPTGWTGYNPSFVRLTGFGMMAGPPDSMTYLVPIKTDKTKGVGVQKWIFGGDDEKWLYCTYDGGGAIQISKRMPDSATECSIIYKDAKLGGVAEMHASCSASPISQAANAKALPARPAAQP